MHDFLFNCDANWCQQQIGFTSLLRSLPKNTFQQFLAALAALSTVLHSCNVFIEVFYFNDAADSYLVISSSALFLVSLLAFFGIGMNRRGLSLSLELGRCFGSVKWVPAIFVQMGTYAKVWVEFYQV